MKMKKLILLILLLVPAGVIFAQEVISTAGETKSNSGYDVSWTVGEPVIRTLSAGNVILTQGFHQSKLIITAVENVPDMKNIITVFPNPTNQFAIVKFNRIPEKNSYQIFDLSGKVLESKIISSLETQIDLTHFANGSYLLKIIQENNQPLQTFKIIKQ